MTPIDEIREGIVSNDMAKVIEGFFKLTGERIEPEVSEEMSEQPVSVPVQEKPVPVPVSEKQDRLADLDFSVQIADKNTKGHYSKPEAIEVGKNKFVDDGNESSDVKTPDVVRTPRRPPVKMVEVTCMACGKKEEVNSNYKTGEFHRCDKCVVG
jgi:hypothetical protein